MKITNKGKEHVNNILKTDNFQEYFKQVAPEATGKLTEKLKAKMAKRVNDIFN